MVNRSEIVSRAIDYIEEHLNQKLDLETVANAIHYSRYHLHRVFSDTVGLTIHDYVMRRQLTEAAKLLVFSEQPIIAIAVLAGYETQQAFSASFKAMYKLSPNQFRERAVFYPLQLKFTLKQSLSFGEGKEEELKGKITPAGYEDIPCWMELVHLAIDGFPCFVEEEYREQLKSAVREKRAFIIKDEDAAVGALIFDNERGSIDFMAVHPQYRKRGIAKAFLDKLMEDYPSGKEISITTFREGDKADTGYREEYRRLGFAESELLVEFGYPTQRFILNPRIREEMEDV